MKNFVSGVRRAVMKPIAACAFAAALMFGGANTASAADFQFSYTTGSASVSGVVTAAMNGYGFWNITGVSGTRTGAGAGAITGLWCSICSDFAGPPWYDSDNYLAGPDYGAVWYNQMDLHYLVGGTQYIFAFIEGYNAPESTEAGPGGYATIDYPYTGRCTSGGQQTGCNPVTSYQVELVPEINASAGLSALAALLGALLILRELFVRRRQITA